VTTSATNFARMVISTLLISAFLLLPLSYCLAEASTFELERSKYRQEKGKRFAVRGSIAGTSANEILTSITAAELGRIAADFSQVKVHLGRKVLNAQVMPLEEYRRLKQETTWRESVHADVLCLTAARNPTGGHKKVRIVGLSGSLAEWLDLHAGMPVAIEAIR